MDAPSIAPRGGSARSCLACKRRKIKCDKDQPCSYCIKLRLQCIYPTPPREGRRAPENISLSRFKAIEATLHRLESKVNHNSSPQPSEYAQPSDPVTQDAEPLSNLTPVSDPRSGRLVCEEGDTRYVTSSFWAGLDNVDGDEPATPPNRHLDPPNLSPPEASPRMQHRGPVFDAIRSKDSHQLHPKGNHVFALWQLFVENVDPVFKILHVPTAQRQVFKASQDLTQTPPAFEGLMFAIYYAAITSVQSSVHLQSLFQEERQPLLDRYRHGVECSLQKANFMSTPDVTTLQALTLFLTCARQSLDKTYIWSMTGLLIRLAMKLGLHRDPAFLEVPPFWAEMRRRLWWCIATLDVRTAEENDMDPFICEHMFDTKFPANVNDADLHLKMTKPAPNLQQHSEILYSLIRFEGSHAARKLVFSPKFTADNNYPNLSLPEKNDFIESLLKDFEHRYLKYCDTLIPISFLTVTSIRIVLAKVKLTISHPDCNNAVPLSNAQLRDLTQSSIEIIEYAHKLRTNELYSRWIWLFQKYIEWDAVAFLLRSLATSPLPDLLDRAWRVVDTFFDTWEDQVPEGDRRWRRLKTLRVKALSKQSPEAASSSSLGPAVVPVAARGGQPDNGVHSRTSIPSSIVEPYPSYTYHHQEYSQMSPELPGQGFDPAPESDYPEWSFDNVPYSMRGSLSWDIEIDETMFNPQT